MHSGSGASDPVSRTRRTHVNNGEHVPFIQWWKMTLSATATWSDQLLFFPQPLSLWSLWVQSEFLSADLQIVLCRPSSPEPRLTLKLSDRHRAVVVWNIYEIISISIGDLIGCDNVFCGLNWGHTPQHLQPKLVFSVRF